MLLSLLLLRETFRFLGHRGIHFRSVRFGWRRIHSAISRDRDRRQKALQRLDCGRLVKRGCVPYTWHLDDFAALEGRNDLARLGLGEDVAGGAPDEERRRFQLLQRVPEVSVGWCAAGRALTLPLGVVLPVEATVLALAQVV